MKLKGRRQSRNVIDLRPKKDSFASYNDTVAAGEKLLKIQSLNRRRNKDAKVKKGGRNGNK